MRKAVVPVLHVLVSVVAVVALALSWMAYTGMQDIKRQSSRGASVPSATHTPEPEPTTTSPPTVAPSPSEETESPEPEPTPEVKPKIAAIDGGAKKLPTFGGDVLAFSTKSFGVLNNAADNKHFNVTRPDVRVLQEGEVVPCDDSELDSKSREVVVAWCEDQRQFVVHEELATKQLESGDFNLLGPMLDEFAKYLRVLNSDSGGVSPEDNARRAGLVAWRMVRDGTVTQAAVDSVANTQYAGEARDAFIDAQRRGY